MLPAEWKDESNQTTRTRQEVKIVVHHVTFFPLRKRSIRQTFMSCVEFLPVHEHTPEEEMLLTRKIKNL